MFFHSFKYAMKSMIRNKSALIWTIIFPVALSTFMYMAFGNIYNKDMVLKTMNVCVVKEEENESFEDLLENLSTADGDEDALIAVSYKTKDEAIQDLIDGKCDGVYFENKDEIKLSVAKSDIPQEILRNIVEQYNKTYSVIEDIAKENPMKVHEAIDELSNTSKSYVSELKVSEGSQDMHINYFYAILAMSCLFGSYAACENAVKMTAGASELGKRRCLGYQSKGIQAIALFLAMWIFQFVIECLTFWYMKLIGVHFTIDFLYVMPVLLAESAVGLSIGIMIGSLPKIDQGGRMGICTVISMSLSVLADLCAGGVKDLVEHTAPILNRINPAVLMADSFYALQVFDTYDRYIRNISILSGMAVVFLIISFVLLRRDRSASI